MGIVLIWYFESIPLDWLGVDDLLPSLIIIVATWFFSSLVFSFFIGLWALCYHKWKRGTFTDVLLLAVLWIVFEYLRLWGFAFTILLGSESLLGPHFSFGFLGYILASSPYFLQFAAFGGVYMLSFIAVGINGLVFWVLFRSTREERRERTAFIIGGCIMLTIFLSVTGTSFDDATTKTVRIAVVNTYFPTSLQFSTPRLERLKILVQEAAKSEPKPDMIILPEDSRFLSSLQGISGSSNFLEEEFSVGSTLIIDSAVLVDETGKIRERIFYFDTGTGLSTQYDKQFLVPGEYIPYFFEGIFTLLKENRALTWLGNTRSYSKGDGVVVGTYKGVRIGGLFCSEILSPSLYKELTEERNADFLVNLASHSWSLDSGTLYRQTKNMAKVHAVQNNRYFVQASNSAPSFVVDNTGQVITESGWGKDLVLYADVKYVRQ